MGLELRGVRACSAEAPLSRATRGIDGFIQGRSTAVCVEEGGKRWMIVCGFGDVDWLNSFSVVEEEKGLW